MKKQRRLNIQASIIKTNKTIKVNNKNTAFQVNIVTELLYNVAIIIEKSQKIKNK